MSSEPRDEWESWSDFDDTLADQSREQVPAEAKGWLADQRFVHGLLRSLNRTDAVAREARIQAILEAARPAPSRRLWKVAAAALVLCAAVLAFRLPGRLPAAEAAVERAAAEMGKDVDRRFTLQQSVHDQEGHETMSDTLELTMRPGMRLLVTGRLGIGPLQFDDVRAGCDGQEAWVVGGPLGMKRALPLAQAEQLVANMGNVLDLGYLDLHALLERLPKDAKLHTVDREQDESGRSLLRIETEDLVLQPRRQGRPVVRVQEIDLLVDEETGLVHRLEAQGTGPFGTTHHMVFEYRGTVQLDASAYKRPW